MKNYKANCTYCISQMCNFYPDREKHPLKNYFGKTYIEVETKFEQAYIESINDHMKMAYTLLQALENYISNK